MYCKGWLHKPARTEFSYMYLSFWKNTFSDQISTDNAFSPKIDIYGLWHWPGNLSVLPDKWSAYCFLFPLLYVRKNSLHGIPFFPSPYLPYQMNMGWALLQNYILTRLSFTINRMLLIITSLRGFGNKSFFHSKFIAVKKWAYSVIDKETFPIILFSLQCSHWGQMEELDSQLVCWLAFKHFYEIINLLIIYDRSFGDPFSWRC